MNLPSTEENHAVLADPAVEPSGVTAGSIQSDPKQDESEAPSSHDAQSSHHTPAASPPAHAVSVVAPNETQIDPELVHAGVVTLDQPSQTSQSGPPATRPALQLDVSFAPNHHLLRLATQTTLPGSIPGSETSTPETPIGLGQDALSFGYDMSRPGSNSDFGSQFGATKGTDSAVSSESGIDFGTIGLNPDDNDASGVPPPKDKPKKSHARKQPADHIKRARNAFILFRKHITDSNLIPPSVEVKHQNISVVAAKMWREAPQEVRKRFQEQARIEKEEHQRKYPGYRYQPVFRRTDIIRRRVRKDTAEDEKVDAVADALIKGKSGGDLEKDIKEQMATRSDMSESEAETTKTSSRRRRKDPGQLSKGAIRAQKAQARAKQMRQNLLGSNILTMSMYNAAAQRAQAQAQAQARMPQHPGAQHHYQYGMDQYMPMGYDMSMYDQNAYAAPPMDSNEMYRLPPIESMGGAYDPNWMQGGEYWGQDHTQQGYQISEHQQQAQPLMSTTDYYAPPLQVPVDYSAQPAQQQQQQAYPSHGIAPYETPPIPQASHQQQQQPQHHEVAKAPTETHITHDPGMQEWTRDGQQTPSGHVIFNERLFDGALGSATLPSIGLDTGPKDEGLSGFDEAVAQANEMPQW